MRNTKALLVAICALAFLIASCGGTPTPEALPERFHGRWEHAGSSGGITGDGRGEGSAGYIVIGSDNTLDTFDDDGTLLRSTEFTPSFGQTIFDDEPQWFLNSSVVSGGGTRLTLSENWPDGFTDRYVRSG